MTVLIAAHASAALICLIVGAVQLFRRPRGDARHRWIGRFWVVAMMWVALSSFWIREIRDGRFSFLHVLSAVTLVTVGLGLVNARRIRTHPAALHHHRGNMIGSWLGLCGAFIFAVAIPHRHIPQFVIAEPVGALSAGLALVACSVAVVWAGGRLAAMVDRQARDGAPRSFAQ